MNYKELQEWSRNRRRQVLVHRNNSPGEVLLFSDGTRHLVTDTGARRRLPDAPLETQAVAKESR